MSDDLPTVIQEPPPPRPCPPRTKTQRRRDAVVFTLGIGLVLSQLVVQILDGLGVISTNPSALILSAGLVVLGYIPAFAIGDRKVAA